MNENKITLKNSYYKDGKISDECWIKNDKEHNEEDLPSSITYYKNGKKKYVRWKQNSLLHRDNDLPALLEYDNQGNLERESWFKNNRLHRDNDLPAEIIYFKNGNIHQLFWYKNGLKHRDNFLPAFIMFNYEGKIKYKYSCINGLRCSFKLFEDYTPIPSLTAFDSDGNIEYLTFDLMDYNCGQKVHKISSDNIIKIVFLFKRYINKFKTKKRNKILSSIYNTKINLFNGIDICNLISAFIY